MTSSAADGNAEDVLPRPVSQLPMPALTAATRRLADRLTEQFEMGDDAAMALALAVVDPASVRRAIESYEELPVPGGVLRAVRAQVWSRYVIPDARNPRVGPARRHPASNLVGRDESTRLRPLAEPVSQPDGRPELIQHVQNQEHLAWAAQQANQYVIRNNDWRESIRNQGVMTEVWIAATAIEHEDGTPTVTVPVTVEGSSRLTCVHDILGVRSADVPYTRDERKFRGYIRKLNDELDSREVDPEIAVKGRCEIIPALLLVGFEPHEHTDSSFGVAVKSLVALRHVDPPTPWGEATANDALADAVIDELVRRNLITSGKAAWLAGELTPDESEAAGFSANPAVRAAAIVRVLTTRDSGIHAAIKSAITSQRTRKRITTKLLLDIAASLALRSLPEEDGRKRERMRKYLKDALSGELVKDWDATLRSDEDLAAGAELEVRSQEPGPASRELAARSAYPLIVMGALTADRGTSNSDQPDRRNPSEVIDRMRTSIHGVHQLRQALVDFSSGRRRVRLVNEDGDLERGSSGRDVDATDVDLRTAFPRPGAGPSPVPAPRTPAEVLGNALKDLATAIQAVEVAVGNVEAVRSDDGTSAIDSLGADPADCQAWRLILLDLFDKLPVWRQRGIQRHGMTTEVDDVDDTDDLDGLSDADDDVAPGGTVDQYDLTDLNDEEDAV